MTNFSYEETAALSYYARMNCPELNRPFSFAFSEKSDAEEPVTWVDGEDYTEEEIEELLLGQAAIEKLARMLSQIAGDKAGAPGVISGVIHTFYKELIRSGKMFSL